MNPDEKRTLIDQYISAYNDLDVDGMLAVLHPEIVFRNLSGGRVTASSEGIQAFRQLAEQSKTIFSSRRQEVAAFRAEGDGAVVDIRYEGVLAADLPNGMKAGERIELDGRSEFGFRDGGIDRITDES